MGPGFWNLKHTHTDMPSPTRPHFLVFFEQSYQLGPDIQLYENHQWLILISGSLGWQQPCQGKRVFRKVILPKILWGLGGTIISLVWRGIVPIFSHLPGWLTDWRSSFCSVTLCPQLGVILRWAGWLSPACSYELNYKVAWKWFPVTLIWRSFYGTFKDNPSRFLVHKAYSHQPSRLSQDTSSSSYWAVEG